MAVDNGEPPTETVPRQTGVGSTVENDGEGVATTDDDQPVVLASYSNMPSALNFKEKSENWQPGYERTSTA
jgi:hypothetical protein